MAIATIRAVVAFDGMSRFTIEAPRTDWLRFIAEKGSIGLDGTSLTVNGIEESTSSPCC